MRGGSVGQITRFGVGLGALSLFATAVPAADFAYGFGVVSEYSSNIDQRPVDERHEWINSLFTGMTYAENTADLVARASGQIEYRSYANDTYRNETIGLLDLSMLWTLSPGRATWTIADALRQVTLDPAGPSTPANRAGANVLETGPDVFLRVNATNLISLGARYGNVYVGDTDLDNDRYGAIARWLYHSSPATQWSANVEHLAVEFDNEVANESFRRDDAFLSVESRQARSNYRIDAGTTRIDRDRSESIDGSLVRFVWRRQLTSASDTGLTLARGYQDVGGELLRYVTPPTTSGARPAPPPAVLDVITSAIYYSREADLYYNRQGNRTGWTVRAVTRRLDFESGGGEDREEAGGYLEIRYLYSATATAGAFMRYLEIEYPTSGRTDEETTAGIRFGYRATRSLTVGLEASRLERQSDDPIREFVDKRALLTLAYTTGPLYTPTSRR